MGLILITMFSNLFVISGLTKWLLFAWHLSCCSPPSEPQVIQMTYRSATPSPIDLSHERYMLGAFIAIIRSGSQRTVVSVAGEHIYRVSVPHTMANAVVRDPVLWSDKRLSFPFWDQAPVLLCK